MRAEEDEVDEAGVVAGADLVGQALDARRRCVRTAAVSALRYAFRRIGDRRAAGANRGAKSAVCQSRSTRRGPATLAISLAKRGPMPGTASTSAKRGNRISGRIQRGLRGIALPGKWSSRAAQVGDDRFQIVDHDRDVAFVFREMAEGGGMNLS